MDDEDDDTRALRGEKNTNPFARRCVLRSCLQSLGWRVKNGKTQLVILLDPQDTHIYIHPVISFLSIVTNPPAASLPFVLSSALPRFFKVLLLRLCSWLRQTLQDQGTLNPTFMYRHCSYNIVSLGYTD